MNSKNYAPGSPGIKARWTSSSKSGIGKALDTTSQVAFTISHGIINEVYYPREDIACVRDMELLIADGKDFFSEEKRDTHHSIKMIKTGIPAYQVTNSCINKKYQVIKEIVTDPIRNTLLQKISFKAAKNVASGLHAYVLLAPHLNDEGGHNSGWIGEYKGIPMLFAQNGGLCLALACSSKFIKRSVGYVGYSDGWRDINEHKKMEWAYTNAENGNIALTAEIDLSVNNEFVLALGFGRSPGEASIHAWGSILAGFNNAKKIYLQAWANWLKTLNNLNGKNLKTSSAVLRMHEAKSFPGGVIASLSIPWGQTKGDTNKGGYHVVWPRDLVESAGGFMALKAEEDTLRILNYLMSTQKADGSWPQNMWLEGSPHWKGMQMDQTALPIVLTCQCFYSKYLDKVVMNRYWPIIKKALVYLIKNGPYTEEDRWEEEKGYSPFTLAAEIAALLSGADLADANGDKELGQYCRDKADDWNDQIEGWTYVTGTSLAKKYDVDGYYIRINPFRDIPANELGDRTIDLKNHHNGKGKTKISELVSVDALSLVRFGLRAANDPKIVNTVKVIDAMLKVDTPNGPSWQRYNNDGYGEHKDGDPYDGTGIGRAWPLLTGERAHFEIANNNPGEADKLLKAMEAFANNGLLSEQIWDTEDIPDKELYFGEHSGSAMPLTWAHAEYIKLCASVKAKKIFDMPPQTQHRYLKLKKKPGFQTWRFERKLKTLEEGKSLRIEVLAKASVKWTDDEWQTTQTIETTDTGAKMFIADVKPTKEAGGKIEFTFYWEKSGNWENQNYTVEINKH